MILLFIIFFYIIFFLYLLILLCVWLPECVYLYHMHAGTLVDQKEGIRVPGTEVTVLSHHMGSRPQIWVLCKTSSLLSSLHTPILLHS